jgi:hypothetical protein
MSASDHWTGHAIDPRSIAIEVAVRTIEAELHQHLDAVQRIAIERALERLADDAAVRRRDPWC